MERVCNESNKYARSKRNASFEMTPRDLQSFLAILLLSDYNPLPRQEMYWQRRKDSKNIVVSSLMTKNEFEDMKQYLNLADNEQLDSTDKFEKVRPLFDSIN